MQFCYSPLNHSELSLHQSQRSGSTGPTAQVLPEMLMHQSYQRHFMLPSPLPAFPGMLRIHSTSWSCSRGRDKPPGGCRSEESTSMPGHYTKQKASPGSLCSNQAAVNKTIYCAPINVQPQDPCMASPIVLSVLIKAGSSRHLRPLQLGQSGSNSEERRRVSAVELCAEQGAFVTQETRSHSREENGNYFGALPSPPQALPMLTPGGINAGRLSACLHPCLCHRTLALTSSLTAMPGWCSRCTHQSRCTQGGIFFRMRQSNEAD